MTLRSMLYTFLIGQINFFFLICNRYFKHWKYNKNHLMESMLISSLLVQLVEFLNLIKFCLWPSFLNIFLDTSNSGCKSKMAGNSVSPFITSWSLQGKREKRFDLVEITGVFGMNVHYPQLRINRLPVANTP